MNKMQEHEFYMKRCIELGLVAKHQGDSPVGAVLVRDKKIVAEGIEGGKKYNDITCHAEIEVIRTWVKETGITDLSDHTLYTTHEPCIMCSYVIRHHKINTIVWGLSTGILGGYSSAYKILVDATVPKWGKAPLIITGILENDCEELHKG